MNKEAVLQQVRGGLIVSCQAFPNEAMYGSDVMVRMALAAREGGAVGFRANGEDDIRSIKEVTGMPVIGIIKREYEKSDVYITATLREVDEVVRAGADVVAVDATLRSRPDGIPTETFLRAIQGRFPDVLLMADISTFEEAESAAVSGVDIIATTMVGYTDYTRNRAGPDLELIQKLTTTLSTPVMAEGRIRRPEEARRCIELGCHAVVVGSAITRPQEITREFVEEILQAERVEMSPRKTAP